MSDDRKENAMKLKYYIPDPTGNITILAEGDVPADKRAGVAAKLMDKEPTAEQVGFISYGSGNDPADISLMMAGGEFCGNATMSAAVLFVAKKEGLLGSFWGRQRVPGIHEVKVLASGVEEICKVLVEVKEDGSYVGTVEMPKPLSVKTEKLLFEGKEYELPVVDFGGITHVIIDAGESSKNNFDPEKAVMMWCDTLRAGCLGLMIYDSAQNRLDPLVYVPEAGTLVWESSCASGTTAIGAYLAHKENRPVKISLTEPGGILTVEAVPGGTCDREMRLLLSGTVNITEAFDF